MENKDSNLRVRVSNSTRQAIQNYCLEHKISLSEFIRQACETKLNQKEAK